MNISVVIIHVWGSAQFRRTFFLSRVFRNIYFVNYNKMILLFEWQMWMIVLSTMLFFLKGQFTQTFGHNLLFHVVPNSFGENWLLFYGQKTLRYCSKCIFMLHRRKSRNDMKVVQLNVLFNSFFFSFFFWWTIPLRIMCIECPYFWSAGMTVMNGNSSVDGQWPDLFGLCLQDWTWPHRSCLLL